MQAGPKFSLALLLCALVIAGCAEAPPRHAVLIVIDTLRADMLDKAGTPHLDALARQGQRPQVTWSSGTWTVPSMISIFTGQHVRAHGWDEPPGNQAVPPLPALPTLAEVLSDHDFATTGIYANPVLRRDLGFRRGFDRWELLADSEQPARVARELEGWRDGRRHFLYLHLMGPHSALTPSVAARHRWGLGGPLADQVFSIRWVRRQRRGSPQDRDRITALYRRAYQAVVEDTDARIGQILRLLEPFREETAIVVTSDHGEMLGERGHFGHASWIYEPLTRIPLIAVHTGPVPERMTLAAVADLITRALGVEADWAVRSLEPATLVSQGHGRFALSPDGRVKGVWRGNGRFSVFDLGDYPRERAGPAERRPELQAARARFDAEVRPGAPVSERMLPDAETLEALRELGYLESEERN